MRCVCSTQPGLLASTRGRADGQQRPEWYGNGASYRQLRERPDYGHHDSEGARVASEHLANEDTPSRALPSDVSAVLQLAAARSHRAPQLRRLPRRQPSHLSIMRMGDSDRQWRQLSNP